MSNVGYPQTYSRNKLRGRIVEKYRTQSAFANSLGISKYAFSRKMNGHTGLTQADVALWCDLLDIDREDIGEFFYT